MALEDHIVQTPEGIWVLKDDSHLSRWIELHKRLDIAEDQIAHFKQYIPEGGTVVDAGASLGDHTETYAKLVGSTGRVHAFEPNPMACLALGLNMAKYPWVQVRRKALGLANGPANMRLEKNAGASHLTGSDAAPMAKVTMRKLDRYAGELLPRLDFVHLDAEGYEPDILIGGQEVLKAYRPVIVLEVNKACLARRALDPQHIYGVLDAIGYRWQEAYPDHNPDMEQRDIIAFPK